MNSKKDFINFTTNHSNSYLRYACESLQRNSCGLLLKTFLFFSLIFIFFSCAAQKLPVKDIPIERDGQVLAVVKAEIASTPEDRSAGLMYRKSLKDGSGMLFVFEKDQILSFWMKNTLIPLSIAYIASDGRIIDIKDMYPRNETSVTSSRSVRYALEVPQGWFSRAGVQAGDIVRVSN